MTVHSFVFRANQSRLRSACAYWHNQFLFQGEVVRKSPTEVHCLAVFGFPDLPETLVRINLFLEVIRELPEFAFVDEPRTSTDHRHRLLLPFKVCRYQWPEDVAQTERSSDGADEADVTNHSWSNLGR